MLLFKFPLLGETIFRRVNMLETFLFVMQIIGGVFYLLNKVLFSIAERMSQKHIKQKVMITAWIVFLIGVPPWLIILGYEHNWIAASIEAVGGGLIILALYLEIKAPEMVPKWLNVIGYSLIASGLSLSLYQFGGLTTFNQSLEIILAISFLIGTYKLPRQASSGYLWYILMHLAAGWLLFIQGYFWLAVLQLLSLLFILDAFWRRRQTNESITNSTKSALG
jgi:hypothetical protein